MAASLTPVMSAREVDELIATAFPQLNNEHRSFHTVEVSPGGCVVRLDAGERHLRPGDTVSGPALFTLADIGGYACVLSHAGPDALSVTTNININFMRKAVTGPIDGRCRILKLGRTLMVYECEIVQAGETIAHATGTYSIPPKRPA